MNLTETLKLAMAAIWAHKLRSALTLLGMVIGVTAVVVVISLINGFNVYIDEKIAGIGSATYSVRRFSFEDFKNTDTIAVAQRRNKGSDARRLRLFARSRLADGSTRGIGAAHLGNDKEGC